MFRFLMLSTTLVSAYAQVHMSCTPESWAAVSAGSISVQEVGRWNCSAKNFGTDPFTLDEATFDLAMPKLHTVAVSRTRDIINVKQKKSKASRWMKALGWAAAGASFVGGLSGQLPPAAVSALAAASVAADRATQMIAPDVPQAAIFIDDLLSKPVVLLKGGTAKWTAYANHMSNADTIEIWLNAVGLPMSAPVAAPTAIMGSQAPSPDLDSLPPVHVASTPSFERAHDQYFGG